MMVREGGYYWVRTMPCSNVWDVAFWIGHCWLTVYSQTYSDKELAEINEVRIIQTPLIAAKPKGGRPPLHPGKPWLAEGISRNTWYKRRRAKP